MAITRMGHKILPTQYLAVQDEWVRDYAKLIVCERAEDAKDAKFLLESLGLLHDTRATDSDSIDDTAPTDRPD